MADWNIVIIGGGATGLTAAADTARAGNPTLVIDSMGGGGELMNLGALHGMDTDETGPDLFARLMAEASEAGAELAIAEVTGLTQTPTGWRVVTDDETHNARAVILATGLAPGTLGLPNEADFEGMGLSHCAICDGPLYAGESVVVAGAGRWAIHDAQELATTASHVTLITQGEPAPILEKITVIEARIVALDGAGGLEAIQLDAAPHRIETQVVFVQTGRRPARAFVPAIPHPTLIDAGTPQTLADALQAGRAAAAAALDNTAA